MNILIYSLSAIFSLCIIYLYWSWMKYQNQCTDFRLRLQIGSRVKFLHNKDPRFGHITHIFTNDAICVKCDEDGIIYWTDRKNIFPRLGAKNKNPLKAKKS